MTVVEFFDVDDIENIVSTLLCNPEKVIFICDKRDKFDRIRPYYEKLVIDRKLSAQFSYEEVDRNSLESIISVLCKIVEQNDECTFDLVGGEDLYLVAVGMVYQMYKDRVSLHRFNILGGELCDCDADGKLISASAANITIEENITAYGGRVIYDDERPSATHRWNYNDKFISDVDKVWEVYKRNSSKWNKIISVTDNLAAHYIVQDEPLKVSLSRQILDELLLKNDVEFSQFKRLFDGLRNEKLIFNSMFSKDEVYFTFKNYQIKRLLTKSGLILEMFVAVSAMQAKDADSNPVYNDVLTGVSIDWDGVVEERYRDVENEIDVIMMKGLVPVFVSCKNGAVDANELYKLNTVAERFGGKHARKVLIATEVERNSSAWTAFLLRAKEMHINVFCDIKNLSAEQIKKKIATLWSNNDII